MAKKDFKAMAESILSGMGGKENVSFCSICLTRLRASVKDKGLVNKEELEKVPGVVGVQWVGEQLQVIVGAEVKKVFDEIQKIANFDVKIEEEPKNTGEFDFKKIPGIILDYISGSVTQIIPVLQVASLAMALTAILGPNILKALPADNGFMVFLNMVYNTGFYFLPVFLGYSSAKKLNLPVLYGILMGTLLITPDFLNAVASGTPINFLGMDIPNLTYSSSVFPVLLCMPIIKLLDMLCNKYLPDVIRVSFASTLTFLIGAPICFLFIAPLGNAFAQVFGAAINWISQNLGILGGALAGGLWLFIVMTGTHMVLFPTMIGGLMANGYENLIMPSMGKCYMALLGIELVALLKIKDKKERSNIVSYCISDWIGNVTEPALYGLVMKYKKSIPALILGGAVGGALARALGAVVYGIIPGVHIIDMFTNLAALGGPNPKLNWAITFGTSIAALVVSFLYSWFFVFNDEKEQKQ